MSSGLTLKDTLSKIASFTGEHLYSVFALMSYIVLPFILVLIKIFILSISALDRLLQRAHSVFCAFRALFVIGRAKNG